MNFLQLPLHITTCDKNPTWPLVQRCPPAPENAQLPSGTASHLVKRGTLRRQYGGVDTTTRTFVQLSSYERVEEAEVLARSETRHYYPSTEASVECASKPDAACIQLQYVRKETYAPARVQTRELLHRNSITKPKAPQTARYVHPSLNLSMHACMHAYYIKIHRDTQRCIKVHIHIYIYIFVYIYIDIYICIYMCKTSVYFIYVYIHIHVHTHTLARAPARTVVECVHERLTKGLSLCRAYICAQTHMHKCSDGRGLKGCHARRCTYTCEY